MITIQIDEEKMRGMLSETFKENIKSILSNNLLEYWVRNEVHKLLAKEIFEKEIKPILTKEKITKMLQDAFNNYVYERLQTHSED